MSHKLQFVLYAQWDDVIFIWKIVEITFLMWVLMKIDSSLLYCYHVGILNWWVTVRISIHWLLMVTIKFSLSLWYLEANSFGWYQHLIPTLILIQFIVVFLEWNNARCCLVKKYWNHRKRDLKMGWFSSNHTRNKVLELF